MQPNIIGIVGHIRAGKTSAARFLTERFGYTPASNSDVLRGIARNLGMEINRENLKRLGDSIFSVIGNETIARFRLSRPMDFPIVVDGIRYREEIHAYSQEPTFRLLGVRAKDKTRYQRAIKSNEDGKTGDIGEEHFLSLSQARSEVHVEELVSLSHIIIENDSTPLDFEMHLEQAIATWSADLARR